MNDTTTDTITAIAKKSLGGEPLSREDALQILNLSDDLLPELLSKVYAIRKKYKGKHVGIQILTNARSGNCSQNCAYCAQSRNSEADIHKYRLVPYSTLRRNSMIAQTNDLARHCIGLSGIHFNEDEIDEFADYVRRLKQESPMHICCSIGFLTTQQAQKLKEAGVDRINHNLNTSQNFYPNICTTHTYEERIANIRMLQGMGFEICCGGIIGLGESQADVADMFLDIRAIYPQAVPVNFLIPLKGTPLARTNTAHLSPPYCLKVLCLARLMTPTSDIRCAAGREVYLKGHEKAMFYAVDSIFASGYLTADGQGIEDTIRLVTDAGFDYHIETS
jgi:biotin synthase